PLPSFVDLEFTIKTPVLSRKCYSISTLIRQKDKNIFIKEEKINFPKYWKSLTVNCVLKDLSVGEHTVRIVVMDEAGHLSNETEFEDSMDTITFSVLVSKGLVIGLSVGGSFILIATLILIWFKIIKKKRMIKK
ncbi:MAG: hypothetical protein ACTSX1_08550, partial [Candidatus Heimdallarchaeaceae archaeon]